MMFIHQGINLKMNEKLLKRSELDEFLITLKKTLTILHECAPSDSMINVELGTVKNGYQISLHLASSALNITELSVAKSPFSALDKVLFKINSVLEIWSIQKNVKHC